MGQKNQTEVYDFISYIANILVENKKQMTKKELYSLLNQVGFTTSYDSEYVENNKDLILKDAMDNVYIRNKIKGEKAQENITEAFTT